MKKMKLISGLVAATMAAISMSSVLATAADGVSISVGKTEKNPGETFSVDVTLSGVPSSGLSSVDFAVQYDASLLTITGVEMGTIANTGAASAEGSDLGDLVWNTNDTGKEVVVVWATGLTDSKYFIKSDGVIATIKGTVSKDAQKGDVANLKVVPVSRELYPKGGDNDEILFSAVSSDTDSKDYAATPVAGAVSVGGQNDTPASIQWGNVDCSNEFTNPEKNVDIADAILLAQYNAEKVQLSSQGQANADVAYNGKVDADDLNLLIEFLAGLKKYSDLGDQ